MKEVATQDRLHVAAEARCAWRLRRRFRWAAGIVLARCYEASCVRDHANARVRKRDRLCRSLDIDGALDGASTFSERHSRKVRFDRGVGRRRSSRQGFVSPPF